MTNLYRLDFFDTSGVQQAILTGSSAVNSSAQSSGFSGLSYTRKVNAPGFMIFKLRGDHELLSTLSDKWQVEVWRKPDGQSWAREFTGLYRQPEWNWGDYSSFQGYCPGLMSILSWRIVNWSAGYADRTVFTSDPAETVANTLVKYNATSDATTGNGRKRDGAITGLTVEADGAAGNTINWYCAQANLLDTIQEIAKIGGGDFDVVKTSSTAWQWRWYEGQLGTDRSASVTFAMELGNMANPSYRETVIDEKTVACVWGQGEGSDRDYATRTGTNYNASTNNIEIYVNAQDVDQGDTSGLNSRGDLKLDEAEARAEFEFDVLQAPATLYGVHYFLGDKVTAVNPFTGTSVTLKIDQVTVSFDQAGSEKIAVGMVEA